MNVFLRLPSSPVQESSPQRTPTSAMAAVMGATSTPTRRLSWKGRPSLDTPPEHSATPISRLSLKARASIDAAPQPTLVSPTARRSAPWNPSPLNPTAHHIQRPSTADGSSRKRSFAAGDTDRPPLPIATMSRRPSTSGNRTVRVSGSASTEMEVLAPQAWGMARQILEEDHHGIQESLAFPHAGHAKDGDDTSSALTQKLPLGPSRESAAGAASASSEEATAPKPAPELAPISVGTRIQPQSQARLRVPVQDDADSRFWKRPETPMTRREGFQQDGIESRPPPSDTDASSTSLDQLRLLRAPKFERVLGLVPFPPPKTTHQDQPRTLRRSGSAIVGSLFEAFRGRASGEGRLSRSQESLEVVLPAARASTHRTPSIATIHDSDGSEHSCSSIPTATIQRAFRVASPQPYPPLHPAPLSPRALSTPPQISTSPVRATSHSWQRDFSSLPHASLSHDADADADDDQTSQLPAPLPSPRPSMSLPPAKSLAAWRLLNQRGGFSLSPPSTADGPETSESRHAASLPPSSARGARRVASDFSLEFSRSRGASTQSSVAKRRRAGMDASRSVDELAETGAEEYGSSSLGPMVRIHESLDAVMIEDEQSKRGEVEGKSQSESPRREKGGVKGWLPWRKGRGRAETAL